MCQFVGTVCKRVFVCEYASLHACLCLSLHVGVYVV